MGRSAEVGGSSQQVRSLLSFTLVSKLKGGPDRASDGTCVCVLGFWQGREATTGALQRASG